MKHFLTVLALTYFLNASGQDYEIYRYNGNPNSGTLVYTGTSPSNVQLNDNRINLIVLADGYDGNATDGNYNRFMVHLESFLTQMFELDPATSNPQVGYTTPFYEYKEYFDVYWVWYESTGNGTGCKATMTESCTHDCTANGCYGNIDTHFGSAFDGEGLHRFALPKQPEILVNTIQSLFGNSSATMSLVSLSNTVSTGQTPFELDRFGGGAKQNIEPEVGACVVTRGLGNAPTPFYIRYIGETVVHELGHTFANLLDEYYYNMAWLNPNCGQDDACNEAINRTNNGDPSSNTQRWKHWIGLGSPTINVTEHSNVNECFNPIGGSTGWFKPNSGACKMNNVSDRFCAVCQEAIIEKIHVLTRTIDDFSFSDPSQSLPYTPEVAASDGETFSLTLLEPSHGDIEVKWYLNGVLKETDTEAPWEFEFSCTDLSGQPAGTYELKAVVRDVTDMVRSHLHPTGHLYFNHDDHDEIQRWNIEWNGSGADLMIRDFYQQYDNNQPISDVGDEPWQPFPLEGWHFDYTSDIKVSHSTQSSIPFGSIEHVNPLGAGQTEYVNVQVTNIGCSTFSGGDHLHLYTSIQGGAQSWPSTWAGAFTAGAPGYEITHDGTDPDPATIPSILPGQSAKVEIPWYVQDLYPLADVDWNSCLLARIEGLTVDPIDATAPASDNLTNWIRYNNNIAMNKLR